MEHFKIFDNKKWGEKKARYRFENKKGIENEYA